MLRRPSEAMPSSTASSIGQHGVAVHAQAVEGPGAYEALNRAAVELLAGHAAAEVLERLEGAVLAALVHELQYELLADVLYRHEAEADVVAHDGEPGVGLVDVRRQQAYAHLAALGDVLRDLAGGVEHAREQRGHVFRG